MKFRQGGGSQTSGEGRGSRSLKKGAAIGFAHSWCGNCTADRDYSKGPRLFFRDVNILPTHLDAAAGVNLQTDHAIAEFRGRVNVVHRGHAVQAGDDVIVLDGNL